MFTCCYLVKLIILMTLVSQGQTIIGGREVVPHSRPYMVLINVSDENGDKGHCSGFLLSEYFVMTAASCQGKSYTVTLGLHDVNNMNEDVQRLTVEGAFPHKDFNKYGLKNDVMLLQLSSKAKMNNNVSPIMISGQDEGCQPQSCTIAGWGTLQRNITYMTPKLMEVNVTLTDNKNCEIDNLYCSVGEIGPDKGDAGAPLVCEGGYAYGVISSIFYSNTRGPIINRFTRIPDSRILANLFLEHRLVCGKPAAEAMK